MNKKYFPTGYLDAQIDKRRAGRIFRAARRVRELQIHSPGVLPTRSQAEKVNELLQDEDAFLKAMQEQADEQKARRQARQLAIQDQ